ncbi:glucosaminidase domain-containing protein [Haliovirga abyssi]|uniref:Mannosyl-glycoprotein endo-beta-N-acetylglucosamidase-like domain-containing protein n=1 Tax=Haliovirga abyssi TaxID=2996794 RepID=A0AAU9DDV6_9FUSO|nr:glucosaminidase domain-containing protein [Haliovirga abyssi]BDU51535.1 hypothetical protein HLVA_21040 [Haliovirga abyssi]
MVSSKLGEIGKINFRLAFFIFVMLFFTNCNSSLSSDNTVVTKKIIVKNISDIYKITDNEVQPIIYEIENFSLKNYSSKEKKEQFINLLLPNILIVESEFENIKIDIFNLKIKPNKNLTTKEKEKINNYLMKFGASNLDELYKKFVVPNISIVLAQAALESGWGSSRFFSKANNIFGIWSFSKKDNRIEALQTRNGKKIYLKKYSNLKESIEDYYTKIIKLKYYDNFRKSLKNGDRSTSSVNYLNSYSEIGSEYIVLLKNIIKYNNLDKFNNFKLKS